MKSKLEIKFEITNLELDEIGNWLKSTKSDFYGNWNIIVKAQSKNEIIILKEETNIIGFLIWSEIDKYITIDIFEIRLEYRKKGIGRLFFDKALKHFSDKDFFAIELFCRPEESEKFWKKMGFIKFPKTGYNDELTYFKPLIEIKQNETEIDQNNKLELWDLEPYQVNQNKPKWTWNINSQEFIPIVNPCNSNWNIRWTKDGKIIKDHKVKYFSNDKNKIEFGSFVFIKQLVE